ncbi:MAG: LL-diaminopimelate aminotransferase [Treponemataceae bacterium]|nr:LL-diaminopimelate aminotransferase [Treponemataceae bacterium]
MVPRNPHMAHLTAGYLFPEIARRKREFLRSHPEAQLISLGIGNTTEPITPHIDLALTEAARALGTREGYSGYGEEQGMMALRERIAQVLYNSLPGIDPIAPEEVFVSDGAKCDIGRFQVLFGSHLPVAVQDPSYPVYVDGSVIIGAAGAWNGKGYEGITYLPCTAENGYFPDLSRIPQKGLVYFCSPNNPTGAVATHAQLETLVKEVQKKRSLLIFDAAYAEFIRDPALPKSIYQIPGAKECAIEVNSFSKPIGFTGVRLGWSIVPKTLRYEDGSSINADWNRICTTLFNGASNIAQQGGIAAVSPQGLTEMRCLTDFYLENARHIRRTLTEMGISCVGGDNSPYIWAHFPGRDSWDVFSQIMEQCWVICTPGSGFGPAGESFIRFSAFGHREDVEEACRRLRRFQ